MQRKQQNTRFQRLRAKYQRLATRLQKALHNGRFARFTHQKQAQLLRLLHRYEAQLKRLGYAAAMSAPLFLAAPTSTQAQLPAIGGEFAVNTYTTNAQQAAAIDADAQGNFIVVWESDGQDEDGFGVFGQLYDNCGNAVGSEFQVNTHTTDAQRLPEVAMDSDGDFVVVWESNLQDGSSNGIYGQRYNSSGTAQGSEFQVNTYTTGFQNNPVVAMDNDGNFVVAWRDASAQDGNGAGVFAQRYNNAGTAQGSEFQVNTYTTNDQEAMEIAMDEDGDFVIVWRSIDQDGSGVGIFGQRFDDMGVAQGSEFQVNTYTTAAQSRPAVAMDSDGDFVVTWQSANQDGSSYGVFAQRYNSAGVTQGSEFQVNTYTTGDQNNTVVAMDSDGDFVVTWNSAGQDGSSTGVYAQQYDNNGNPQGSEFLVNTYTTSNQSFPTVAMESDGDFVIAWQSYGQDGDNYGIYAQRYGTATGTPPSAAGGELQVNTYTTSSQRNASVAMDSDGDFVVVWNSYGQDGDGEGIYGQRYNSSGVAQGPEFQVNTYTTSFQLRSSVAMDSDGDFVFVWQSNGQDGDNFGVFAQRYADVVLPVELTTLEAHLHHQQTHLHWRTASEQNNEGFEVERLAPTGWKMLGFVEGRGTSAAGNSYTFVDENPLQGVNYYRLKQVDFDGNFEHSNIVSVEFSVVGSQLSVFPNPTQGGSFTVLLPAMTQPTATLELYDLTGRRLLVQVLQNQETTISTAYLPRGMYQVVVQLGGEVLVARLVVGQ